MALKREKLNGSIDQRSVRAVCDLLKKEYGVPRLGNPRDSIDDFVYIVLSNKTSSFTSARVYGELKKTYPTWESVLTQPLRKLSKIIGPAGLGAIKASQIRKAFGKIKRDFGEISLAKLKLRGEQETLSYLRSLPGVSDKVARCIMIYTMGAQLLPVDVHVHRITVRLGWTSRKRADQCHDELEAIVAPELRYAFHVDCIVHGRQVCRPVSPICESCCIRKHCAYFAQARKES